MSLASRLPQKGRPRASGLLNRIKFAVEYARNRRCRTTVFGNGRYTGYNDAAPEYRRERKTEGSGPRLTTGKKLLWRYCACRELHGQLLSSSVRSWAVVASLAVAVCVLMWALWDLSATSIVVDVDGSKEKVRTHRRDVDALLLDLGLDLAEGDKVTPARESAIQDAIAISVARATSYRISVDGRLLDLHSWGSTIEEVLADADLNVQSYDQILLGDQQVSLDDEAPPPQTHTLAQTFQQAAWESRQSRPHRIRVNRAVPITVDEGALPFRDPYNGTDGGRGVPSG